MSSFFFDGWMGPARIVVIGPLAYVALIIILRISGKRTLSKFNAFDFVVTIALGSTLATIILNRSVTLIDGAIAMALLIVLQYAVTWFSVRSPVVDSLVKSEPTLLAQHGEYLTGAMKRQRVTKEEVDAALRSSGLSDVRSARCVILETDGSISVVPDSGAAS